MKSMSFAIIALGLIGCAGAEPAPDALFSLFSESFIWSSARARSEACKPVVHAMDLYDADADRAAQGEM